jgi:clan AA aspartic protease (TIGR02281 family)
VRSLVSLLCALAVLGAVRFAAAHDVPARPGIRSVLPPRAGRSVAASHDIPLAGDGQQVIVEGTFNDAVSGPMLVDTGASYCVLTRATARRLGLRPRASTAVPVVTANGEVAAGLVTLSSVKIENARLAYVDAVIMDAVEPPLVGIIGLTFLRNFRYSVDHSAGIFRLER